ncbi:hypothetical protein JQ617_39630 [Bradyrhizobium sp. KB893862 SZCCT0404]|uniref:hypothetical protein n=1 Tax=Bradyrhizobium sp. KB893862 SZCCT0404 TaxID=2807672 RepID=UPI001BA7B21F|nr:hypothetical protein [Bradyrhizobium sp. KB893862 SZCCT0404]MBR1180136.1 hypothetical protein [Bradyrhizobium sp. KB893862 SZCCT0404]
MRKRLVAWTILTCALVAVAVWTLLGPPDRPAGPHLPSRNLTAAVHSPPAQQPMQFRH